MLADVIRPVYGGDTLAPVSSSPSPGRRWHPSHPRTLGTVALGGAVGAALRWVLELALPVHGWPWSTLLANAVGSAALAALVVHDDRHAHPRWLRPGVGTGLLGGFTTFSAVTHAVDRLVADGDVVLAAGYLVATVVVGVLAAYAGLVVGGRVAAPDTRGNAA